MSGDDEKMAPDTVVAGYRIKRVLGEGGMGVVYAAEHVLMRKEVAVKVLHADMCTMPEVVARFEREAVAAANIDHPNVAAATDFGRLPNGAFYLALEFLKGTSLRDEIAKGPIPLARALVIMRGIANGVAAAHAKGIVHRDLKPENVMLVERDGMPDFVKVLDFGIAKIDANVAEQPAGSPNIVTRVGTIFGTPEYMAPEQAVGDPVDARADIFALGVIFLEMLQGQCPFGGQVLNVLRERILMTTPLDLSAVPTDGAKALITKMMQRHADDRLQSTTELIAAIDALETPEPPAVARSVISIENLPRSEALTMAPPERPRWLIPAAIASAAGIIVVVAAMTAAGDGKSKDGAKHARTTGKPAHSATLKNVPPALKPPPPPPPPAPEPEPEPEEPEPAPAASSSSTPSTAPARPRPGTQPAPRPRQRKTGPGGIYIPPPSEWFK